MPNYSVVADGGGDRRVLCQNDDDKFLEVFQIGGQTINLYHIIEESALFACEETLKV